MILLVDAWVNFNFFTKVITIYQLYHLCDKFIVSDENDESKKFDI